MADVVVAEFMDEAGVATLSARYEVDYRPDLVEDRPALLDAITDCRALVVRNRTSVDRALLDAAPSIEVVGRLGVGLDNIDVAACQERGIQVRAAVGANAGAVGEYVLGAALLMVRGVFGSTQDVAAGRWPRTSLVGGELSGRTMGLIGMGAIAQRVARLARSFGMRTVGHDPFLAADDPAWSLADASELGPLMEEADVISIHVPLTDDTRHLIDEGALARVKPGAVIINSARGGVIDESALVSALRAHRLGGAVLDVFEEEPLTEESTARFADVPNLILTPHVAGLTHESGRRVGAVVAAAVIEVLG